MRQDFVFNVAAVSVTPLECWPPPYSFSDEKSLVLFFPFTAMATAAKPAERKGEIYICQSVSPIETKYPLDERRRLDYTPTHLFLPSQSSFSNVEAYS